MHHSSTEGRVIYTASINYRELFRHLFLKKGSTKGRQTANGNHGLTREEEEAGP